MDITSLALLIPLAGIIFGIAMIIAIFWLIVQHRDKRNQLVYDTAVKLAERGLPVPPELFVAHSKPNADLRRGIVLLLLGIALCISLYEVGAPWTFGFIPAFMGIGYLIIWFIEGRQQSV